MLFTIFMIYAVPAILTAAFLSCLEAPIKQACVAGFLWPHFWWFTISRWSE